MIRKLLHKLDIESKMDFQKLVIQFIKFGLIGVTNTFLSLIIYYSLIWMGLHYIMANTAGFLISVINAYYWNQKHVFSKESGDGSTDHRKTMPRVFGVYTFTFLLSTVLIWLWVERIGISAQIAPIINMCITVPLNFLLNKLWAFG